jgi:large subunit ribosomal protein L10
VISEELAGLLQTLGITPFEISLKILAMYDDGVMIPRDQLLFDIEEVKNDFINAAKEAIGLAVEIVYPAVPEAVEAALAKAFLEAKAVAGETGLLLPGLEEDIIARAVQEELAVIAALGDKAKELGLEAVATPAPAPAREEEKKEEEKKEEEEEKEEEVDLSEGLGGLFGM